MKGIVENHIIENLPFAEYLTTPGVSKSSLDIFHRCPTDYLALKNGTYNKPTSEAMSRGSILHALILEGRQDYIIRPDEYPSDKGMKPWSGNSSWCKYWLADHSEDTVLSQAEADEYNRIADLVRADKLAAGLLAKIKPEVSIFSDDAIGHKLKGRVDGLGDGWLLDLKTARDASKDAFSREILKRRYHVQAAMYFRILANLKRKVENWYFIIVETGLNPKVNVRRLNPLAIYQGERELEQDLTLLKYCEMGNKWPTLSGDGDEILGIDLPEYAYSETEDELEGATEAV